MTCIVGLAHEGGEKMSIDHITVGQLMALSDKILEDKKLTLEGWKNIVREFGKENNLTNKEAVFIARLAYRSFGW
jgi:hypothetical protein